MHTAQIVFNLLATIIVLWMSFIFSSKDALNVSFKMFFFAVAVFGVVIFLKSIAVV